MGFQGYDIASGFNNYSNLLAQGYKDQLALRQYQEQAALKAQQQAFQNEIMTREAESKFGGRSYNQDLYPGLFEDMIPEIAGRYVDPQRPPIEEANPLRMPAPYNPNPQMPQRPQPMYMGGGRGPSSVSAPGASTGSSGYPSLPSSPQAELEGNFESALPAQGNGFGGNRSPGMAMAPTESTGEQPGFLSRMLRAGMQGLNSANLSGGGPRNQDLRVGTKSVIDLPPTVLTSPAPKSPPAVYGDYQAGSELPGRGLQQMMNRATDLMATSPQANSMLERSKLETKNALVEEHLQDLIKSGEKKPNTAAVNKVAQNVVDTFVEASRDPAMDLESLARRLGGYVDPYTGRAKVPKGAMEMLMRLEEKQISSQNKGSGVGDMFKMLAAQNAAANLQLRSDIAERNAAIALSGRQNPQAQYQAQGIQAQINSARDEIKNIDAAMNTPMAMTYDKAQRAAIADQKAKAQQRINELSAQLANVGGRPMDYGEAIGTIRGVQGQAPQAQGGYQQAPAQQAPQQAQQPGANKVRNLPDGSVEITLPNGKKRAIPRDVYEKFSKGK